MEVCRVHGDFTPANLFEAAGVPWICDWEYSAAAGPICTDETSYRVGRDYRRCFAKPDSVIAELLGAMNKRQHPAGDVAAALAFLCSYDIPPAEVLAAHWSFKDEAQSSTTSAPDARG